MLTTAIAGLQQALDADPWDATARLILADAYEEMGQPDAAALQRWLAKEGKCPDPPQSHPCGKGRGDRWAWTSVHAGLPKWCRLPVLLWERLPASTEFNCWRGLTFTRQEAEDLLLAAYQSLSVEDRPV